MAISNATLTTQLDIVINSEEIETLILDVHREPVVSEAVAWFKDMSTFKAGTAAFPKAADVSLGYSESSGKAETDTIAASQQTFTEVTISPATVPIRQNYSDEALQDSIPDMVAFALRQNIAVLRNQKDTDFLANFTDGTQTGGLFTGNSMTNDRIGQAIASAKALNFTTPNMVGVLSRQQVADWASDVRSTAAALFAGGFGDSAAQALLNANARGLLGRHEGVLWFESGNCPAFDGSNDCGAIFAAGRGGAIALAEWVTLTNEIDRQVNTLSHDIVSRTRYGTGLVDDENLLRVVSLAA